MLKFTGDINFSDGFFDQGLGVGSSIMSGNDPFEFINRYEGDIWIGNCECVISDISTQKGKNKSNQFRISPSYVNNIKHLDIYNIANNHVMQHGKNAYMEMQHFFNTNRIKTVGSLTNKTHIIKDNNFNIGIISFSQRNEKFSKDPQYWYNPSYIELSKEIAELKEKCDYCVAYIHWGNEFINFPYRDQISFAHYIIDCGIDLIIGMHPHILQGKEIYNGKTIFYSLGNFVFNMPTIETKLSIVVSLDLSNNKTPIDYEYYYPNKRYQPRPISSPKDEHLSIEYLSEILRNNNDIEHEEYYKILYNDMNKYRRKNHLDIIKNLPRTKLDSIFFNFLEYMKRHI